MAECCSLSSLDGVCCSKSGVFYVHISKASPYDNEKDLPHKYECSDILTFVVGRVDISKIT